MTQDDTGASIKQRYYHDKFPQFFDASLAAAHPELFDTEPPPSARRPAPQGARQQLPGRPDVDPEVLLQRRALLEMVRGSRHRAARQLTCLLRLHSAHADCFPVLSLLCVRYFRYRYAPLASDMRDLASIQVHFKLGQPFRPLEQLLGVLPPASRGFLPPAYRELMLGDSVIADFYPLQFAVDMNGKRNAWEGIALIPFIEERRLLDAVRAHRRHLASARWSGCATCEWATSTSTSTTASNTDTYPASLPSFPPITECHSKVSVWTLPSHPALSPPSRRPRRWLPSPQSLTSPPPPEPMRTAASSVLCLSLLLLVVAVLCL